MGQSRFLHRALILAALPLLAACGADVPAEPRAADAVAVIYGDGTGRAAQKIDRRPEVAGAITGTVRYTGPKRPRPKWDLADDYCVDAHPDGLRKEGVNVNERGELRNAYVAIREGLGAEVWPAPGEVLQLDQQGCEYTPHVFGIQVGQTLDIRNSDPILHNVHYVPVRNKEQNLSQTGGKVDRVQFLKPESPVRIFCEVHNWMICWAHVSSHPFFAVSGEDGSFTLRNVPPGTFKVVAWHEELGELSLDVEVKPKETAALEFEYK
ncbi:MAG: carboxypeptidase regulatory-like domain-containing protein [Planctomycetaceae bacterium]